MILFVIGCWIPVRCFHTTRTGPDSGAVSGYLLAQVPDILLTLLNGQKKKAAQ